MCQFLEKGAKIYNFAEKVQTSKLFPMYLYVTCSLYVVGAQQFAHRENFERETTTSNYIATAHVCFLEDMAIQTIKS